MISPLFRLDDQDAHYARRLTVKDAGITQAMLERCIDYFDSLTGLPPEPDEAESLFTELPGGKSLQDKLPLGIFDRADQLVGVLEVVRDYPVERHWYVGLLLIAPDQRGQGLGEKCYRALERFARAARVQTLQLSVLEHNEKGYRFWQRMGFQFVERYAPSQFGSRTNILIAMRRDLGANRGFLDAPRSFPMYADQIK